MPSISFFQIKYWLLGIALISLTTCSRPPEFPDEPVIEFIGLSKNTIIQSRSIQLPKDTIEISFKFTDGDGNLGNPDSVNIILTDSRDGFNHLFKIGEIPQLGAGKGIQGNIKLSLTNRSDTRYFCCTFPNTRLTCIQSTNYPKDSLYYSIKIKDRAGNWSNTIKTNYITILCQ
jgi:hypothetical protein